MKVLTVRKLTDLAAWSAICCELEATRCRGQRKPETGAMKCETDHGAAPVIEA